MDILQLIWGMIQLGIITLFSIISYCYWCAFRQSTDE